MHNGAGPAVLSVVAGASSAVVAARSKAATAASAIGGPSSSGRCMMKTSTLAFRSAALPFVVSSTGTTTDTSAAVDARDGRLATKMRHTGGRGPQRRMRSTTASSPECLYRVLVGPYPRCRKRVPCAVCRVPCAVCRVPRAACCGGCAVPVGSVRCAVRVGGQCGGAVVRRCGGQRQRLVDLGVWMDRT